MKIIKIAAALAIFCAAGCVSVARIPEEKNPAVFMGEASYFASRCPKLQQDRVIDGMLAYCLANKVYAGGCEKKAVDNFFEDEKRGRAQAQATYSSMPDDQVCRIAEERYGKKGSRFVGMLVAKKK
jgi:hypothetical protein